MNTAMTDPQKWHGGAARLYRIQKGWTLDQVASALRDRDIDVNPSTIWRWEGGAEPSNREQVRALARVLDCSQRAFYHEPIITWKKE